MKLNKRGERVFAVCLLTTSLVFASAIALSVQFFLTHERVTDQASCQQTEDGLSCDFTWEAK